MINGNLAFGIGWWGTNQSGSGLGNLVGKSCVKILREREEGKTQLKKSSDWWKLSIWNRVMGSQPIRIQLGKIWQENLAEKSCLKILRENLMGKSGEKLLRENLVRNSCGKFCLKFLQENLAGKSCRKILWENHVGNSCGKFLREILQENLVGNAGEKSCLKSCRKFLREILWEILCEFFTYDPPNQSLEPPLQKKMFL